MDFDIVKQDQEEKPFQVPQRIIPQKSNECPDCKGSGIVKDPKSGVHTCWKCLQSGKLDAHSRNLPNNEEIKL